jgi:hypothetical protein
MKSYPMPSAFDGAKFERRYGLSAIRGDFWSDGKNLIVPDNLPDDPPIFEAPDPPGPSITDKVNSLPGNVSSAIKEILLLLAKGR